MNVQTKVTIGGKEIEVEVDLNSISSTVREYAEDTLGMIEEDDCEECDCEDPDISDFNDNELIEECKSRGLYVAKNTSRMNILEADLLNSFVRKFRYLTKEQKAVIEKTLN